MTGANGPAPNTAGGLGIDIRPFTGNTEELHQLALESWRDEYGFESFPDLYRPEFLRYVASLAPDDHVLGAYVDGELAGYVANLPRTISVGESTCRGVLSALLFCRKAYLRRGVADSLIQSALRLNDAYGYELALFYVEASHRSAKLFERLGERGHRIRRMRRLVPYARSFDLDRTRSSESLSGWQALALRATGAARRPRASERGPTLRPYTGDDLAACLDLAHTEARRCDLARRFEPRELDRALTGGGARTFVATESGQVAAFVNLFPHRHIGGATPETWAWVAYAAFGSLAIGERRRLYTRLCARLADAGYLGCIDWNLNSTGPAALLGAGFVPFPRSIGLFAWDLGAGVDLGRVRRVFEWQL